ncbi:hypothetical protein BRADI_4g25276v3, partial [Brachypodium distachyon]
GWTDEIDRGKLTGGLGFRRRKPATARRGGAPASGRDGEMAGDDGAARRRRGRGQRRLGRRGSAPKTGRAGGAGTGTGTAARGRSGDVGATGKTRGGAARHGGDGARSGTVGDGAEDEDGRRRGHGSGEKSGQPGGAIGWGNKGERERRSRGL